MAWPWVPNGGLNQVFCMPGVPTLTAPDHWRRGPWHSQSSAVPVLRTVVPAPRGWGRDNGTAALAGRRGCRPSIRAQEARAPGDVDAEQHDATAQ